MLEKLQEQYQIYVAQRNQAQVNYQQLSGAILALEELMKTSQAQESIINQGDSEDGNIDYQDTKQDS